MKKAAEKKLEIPDEMLFAGSSTLGSLLGMILSQGTRYENTGAIWGGFAGSLFAYWLIKKDK
ncbi:hypothetical protein [Flexithrix dorotheae]|uniref:hypothetical protein n=1 Tax=Flexithrix dorotheae TaxID=70993 RepID=UPI000376C595|nr:hypothetical protein [Flexithrix dorotheae]